MDYFEELCWLADRICKEAKHQSDEDVRQALKEFTEYRVGLLRQQGVFILLTHGGLEKLYERVNGAFQIDTLCGEIKTN